MKTGEATGLQIAFLMFAVMLLAVPLGMWIVDTGNLDGAARFLAERGTQFALACLVFTLFPRLRRFAVAALSTPIPRSRRLETAVVTIAKLTHAFAGVGALVIWFWLTEGPAKVEQMIVDVEGEAAKAFSEAGLARLALAVLVAPIVEELLFRGFIYRAFERQWGWLASMLATSVLFGLYHPHFWSAFASSIVFVCLLRRTGSLWAPIVCHMVTNFALWWPVLGRFLFPYGVVLSDPSTWIFHWTCLAFGVIAIPVYAWMSRDRATSSPTVMLDPHAALPK
jgi:membrane protease YdiL (CAAX protease family)